LSPGGNAMSARRETSCVDGSLDGRGVIDRTTGEGWDDGANEAESSRLLGGDLGRRAKDEFFRAAEDATKTGDEERLGDGGRRHRGGQGPGGGMTPLSHPR